MDKDWVKEINQAFTKTIINHCKNKKHIMLTLTAGMDTRTILSILVKHNIKFDAFTHKYNSGSRNYINELKVAQSIGRRYVPGKHVFLKADCGEWTDPVKTDILDNYDPVIMGLFMTEILCKYEFVNHTEKQYSDNILKMKNEVSEYHKNFFIPMLEKNVLNASRNIPRGFMAFSRVQREIIKQNTPSLLYYPTTSYSAKRHITSYLYNLFAEIGGLNFIQRGKRVW